MSETAGTDAPTIDAPADTAGFMLDGDAPRLAAAPTIATPPSERPASLKLVAPMLTGEAPTLPLVSPVLTSSAAPVLPAAGASHHDSATNDKGPDTPTGEPEHPMAHLMPSKQMPTEASRRAAEQRAIRKAKSKKVKIGVVAGMLVASAIVGPPLGKWLVDAVNEAGNTTTVDEPAE